MLMGPGMRHGYRNLDATPYDVNHFSYFRDCVEERENLVMFLHPDS